MYYMLHYMQTDFPWRPGNHRMLTFSIMYSFNENFVLPLSHDEVVNGNALLLAECPETNGVSSLACARWLCIR